MIIYKNSKESSESDLSELSWTELQSSSPIKNVLLISKLNCTIESNNTVKNFFELECHWYKQPKIPDVWSKAYFHRRMCFFWIDQIIKFVLGESKMLNNNKSINKTIWFENHFHHKSSFDHQQTTYHKMNGKKSIRFFI